MTAPRVLVVGDVMLDRYWYGDVTRISPEAPVPVVKIDRVDDRLGGAANVARNVAAMGGWVELVGLIGTDEAGSSVRRLLREAGIGASHVSADAHATTTVKTRVIGHRQQMLRMDIEAAPSAHAVDAMTRACVDLVYDCDVVVLSDYDKGALAKSQTIIYAAREAGVPVLVDPKGTDWNKYAGATLIKPNLSELMAVVGPLYKEKITQLRLSLGIGAVLVTCGEAGMSLFWGGETIDLPANAREVFDVTGAGDTVIAAMAVAHTGPGTWSDKMRFASTAAGIVVGKVGTSVATRAEVDASCTN